MKQPRHRNGRFAEEHLDEADIDLDLLDEIEAEENGGSDGTSWAELPEDRRRRDLEWATDVVEHCDLIAHYLTKGREAFDDPDNPQWRDSVEMRFIKIRHAVKELSSAFRDECGIEGLDALVGMTDRLAHDYAKINYDIVWRAARDRLPRTRSAFKEIVDRGGPQRY